MKHIEFLGIPGSGKSTLCELTVEYLQQQGKPACSFKNAFRETLQRNVDGPVPKYLLEYAPKSCAQKYRMYMYRLNGQDSDAYQLFFTEYPKLGSIIPEYIAKKANNISDRRVYSNWFYDLITRYQFVKDVSQRWVVIDEGFVNRTITLFCGLDGQTAKNNDLELYLNSIPTPDLVIVPQISVEASASRIRSGNRSFPYKVSETDYQEQLSYLEERKVHVATVLKILNSQGIDTLRIDNSGTKDEAEEQLKTKVNTTLLENR